MYFIVPFIFLFIVVWVVMLMAGGVTLAMSTDKPVKNKPLGPANMGPTNMGIGNIVPKPQPPEKKVLKPYIVISPKHKVEITPKEVKHMEKQNYRVVWE